MLGLHQHFQNGLNVIIFILQFTHWGNFLLGLHQHFQLFEGHNIYSAVHTLGQFFVGITSTFPKKFQIS